jgi:predicted nucleotidyltransferase
LIERSDSGHQVYYLANRAHPAFPELRGLLAKTAGIFQLLKSALTRLSDRVDIAFVYGSVSRGDDTASSDIDLFVAGTASLDEVLGAVAPLEKQLGRPVNPTIYSLNDLRQRLHEGNHFLRSLEKSKKVFLIGDEDGFRKAGSIRLVQD